MATTLNIRAPARRVRLNGALGITGDIAITTGVRQFNVAPTAAIGLSGAMGLTGNITAQTKFNVVKTNTIAMSGSMGITGQIQFPATSSFWEIPTLADERTFYDLQGYIRTASDELFTFPSIAPTINTVVDPAKVHGDLEGDDLWVWYQQLRRGHPSDPALNWANAWLSYYKNDYLADITPYSSGTPEFDNDYDHVFGYGLVLYGVLANDTAALAAAEAIGDIAIKEYSANGHDSATPQPVGVYMPWSRASARWLILFTYLSKVPAGMGVNTTKWAQWRDWLTANYLDTPCWMEAPNGNVVQGGHYFTPRTVVQAGGTDGINHNGPVSTFDAGRRFNSTFYRGLQAEALWRVYNAIPSGATKDAVRARLIKMADYVLYYGFDPTQTNDGGPFAGADFGHEGDGTRYHRGYQGSFTTLPPPDNVPPMSETGTYDCAVVNTLMIAYKFTNNVAYKTRAIEHFRNGTRWAEEEPAANGAGPLVPTTEIYKFVDTVRKTTFGETHLFNWNKGQLLYCYLLFENPTPPPSSWTPPYPVPTVANQVVVIGGYAVGQLAPNGLPGHPGTDPTTGQPYYITSYPTNTASDVATQEAGAKAFNSAIMCESHPGWIGSYSQGGALGTAGTGGHGGQDHFGGWVFDFTDAKHKRIYTGGTTDGSSGLLAGTKVHNLPPVLTDSTAPGVGNAGGGRNIFDKYTTSIGGTSWYPPEWTPTGQQLAQIPLQANPRLQTWECTNPEPYPYNVTQITDPSTGEILQGPHGWPYPGEWSGMQGNLFRGRVGASNRLNPQPSPSTIPIPAHCWDLFFEVIPADGGGTKGTLVSARHAAAGEAGTNGTVWPHGFDLATGLWTGTWSTNESYGRGPAPTPYTTPTATGGALDPVKNRFFIIGNSLDWVHMNYVNISGDKTWRGLTLGAASPNLGRIEGLTCDHDRRLLLHHNYRGHKQPNPFECIKILDISGMDNVATLNTLPSGCGWLTPPFSIVAPAALDPPSESDGHSAERKWVYYPPNGKFYSYKRIYDPVLWPTPPVGVPKQNSTNGYPNYVTTLDRLTPPPLYSGPPPTPVNYYAGQPWVWDQITLSIPMLRASRGHEMTRYPKRLRYVPTLQLLAWIPIDDISGDPVLHAPVYLIKPA